MLPALLLRAHADGCECRGFKSLNFKVNESREPLFVDDNERNGIWMNNRRQRHTVHKTTDGGSCAYFERRCREGSRRDFILSWNHSEYALDV